MSVFGSVNFMGSLMLALLVLSGTSCRSGWRDDGGGTLTQAEVDACLRGGGEIMDVCLAMTPACVTPYRDAGKACNDSSECAGMCLYEGEDVEVGSQVSGVCQWNDNPCGCFSEIVDGRLTQGLCAD